MQLRRARLQDAPAIAEVHVRAWKDAYPGLLPQDYLDALRAEDRVAMWQEALAGDDRPVVLVGERSGRVVAFCSFGPVRDADLDPAEVGEVHTIYLDPSVWGTGAGRQLLEAAVEQLRGAGFRRAVLWMLETNAHARGFYEHLGWQADGATKRHDWVAFVATDVRYTRDL